MASVSHCDVDEFHDMALGAEYLETFVDPGPPFDPIVGPPDVWFRQVIDHMAEIVMAFRHDGTIVYTSASTLRLLGRDPRQLVGTNALDLVHPDDLAIAAETLYHAAQVEGYRPARPLRLITASGISLTFEVEGLSMFHVPEVQSVVVVCRYADEAARVDTIIGLLASHSPTTPILDQLVYLLKRPGWRLGVAIQYDDGGGGLQVAHTALPPLLTELRSDPHTPWVQARRDGRPIYDLDLRTVGVSTAAAAREMGYRTCWAVPVPDPGGEAAVVVVWNHEKVAPELGQEIVLEKLCNLLSLALAGRARASALEMAADTDVLSSLANRRRFDTELEANQSADVALVFIDLDGFKAVNDSLGHSAGDEVIRIVGSRIRALIQVDEIAARLGGDEFVILCRGNVGSDHLTRLAERLLEELAAPVEIDGQRAALGLSIGIAIAASRERPDPRRLMQLADEMLYAAKRAGKGCFRLGQLPPAG